MRNFEGFRAMAHFLRQLGDVRVAALLDQANIGKVKELCDVLVELAPPTVMTIEGRTYDILGFLWGDESSVAGDEMVTRAVAMNAHLGQDDGKHILKYQDQIPEILRGRVDFVFTDWRFSVAPDYAFYLSWGKRAHRWVKRNKNVGQYWRWDGGGRVLCRK